MGIKKNQFLFQYIWNSFFVRKILHLASFWKCGVFFITRDAVNLQLTLTDFLNKCRRHMLLVRSGGWGGLPWEIFGILYLLWKMWPISVKKGKPVWICAWSDNPFSIIWRLFQDVPEVRILVAKGTSAFLWVPCAIVSMTAKMVQTRKIVP